MGRIPDMRFSDFLTISVANLSLSCHVSYVLDKYCVGHLRSDSDRSSCRFEESPVGGTVIPPVTAIGWTRP